MNPVIAMDGPAASGKSSVARRVAQHLGRLYVNTGNMYRAVTSAVIDAGLELKDAAGIAAFANGLKLDFIKEDGHIHMLINGRRLSDDELNTQAVNAAVSLVAQVAEVRTLLVDAQRALTAQGDLVMEGRDIGSVVFPGTPLKFYIDASEEVRAARRSSQGHADTVALRDKLDSTRKTAPLIVPEGAVRIDSSDLTLEQVVARVLSELSSRGAA
jgi:cytidylate kinase